LYMQFTRWENCKKM